MRRVQWWLYQTCWNSRYSAATISESGLDGWVMLNSVSRTDHFCRQQPDLLTECLQLPGPVVGAAARLHRYQVGHMIGEVLRKFARLSCTLFSSPVFISTQYT